MYNLRSKSSPFSTFFGFFTKHCMIYGIHSTARFPRISGAIGTSRHARNSIPSLAMMFSNIFFAWFLFNSSCGKKNIPTPYSRSPPMSIPSFSATLLKNLWEICKRIPTPSPVFPSPSFPARCSRLATISNAFFTVLCVFFPLILTIAPIPQLSCSNRGSYKPIGFRLHSSTYSLIEIPPCIWRME